MNRRQAAVAAAAGGGLAAWAFSRKREIYELRGKVVLITGGSRGLGLQLAREFGGQGARIVICARDRDELERARLDLEGRGIPAHAIVCDITERAQMAGMVEEAAQRMGPIDVAVNNAGVIEVGPLENMALADFERAMSVIFWGTVYTTFAVLPRMRERGQGRIVNITSVGGKVSVPHLLPYSCAKFASVAFSEGLRAELAGTGIRVTTIVPGLMRTGSHLAAEFKGQHGKEFAWFSLGAATPLISISVERAAKSIARATRQGDAEKILSLPADLLTRFHGVFPELTADILGLVNRYLLPHAADRATAAKSGREASGEINSKLFEGVTRMGRSAAEKMNEIPAKV